MLRRRSIDFEKGWKRVQKGIKELKRILDGHRTQFNSEEYMMLYTKVFDLCVQKTPNDHSRKVYYKYIETIEEYITTTVMPSITTKNGEFMLGELVHRWSNHKLMVRWLSRCFQYLDRYFLVRAGLPGLTDAGFTCFLDMVYMEVLANAREAVIALINRDREGEPVERSLLRNVVDMFVEIGRGKMDRYEQDFELPMLEDTANYYRSKAAIWIEVDSCPEYMLKAEDCLRRETERAVYCLHSSTDEKLIENVRHELLGVHAKRLLEMEGSGCVALLRDGKVEDLSRMFRLYSHTCEDFQTICDMFKQNIIAEGTALLQQAEEAANNQTATGSGFQVVIRKFVELHDKYIGYLHNCFMHHTKFHEGLKEIFEQFCKRTVAGCSSAELLASFCDYTLKKGESEMLSDETIDQTLEKVVKVLAYCGDKDLFAEFYRKKLAHRLIFFKNANVYQEKIMLSMLKQHYGSQFTSTMEGMVIDFMSAEDNQIRFERYLRKKRHLSPGIDLTVYVLTTSCWPKYKTFDLNLPAEMIRCMEVFNGFYETRTRTRTEHKKLTWIYSLGTCRVDGNFESNTIQLIVSTYQAAALMLFNDADTLSFLEIMTQLNLNREDLARLLHSLSCGKYKILKKEPNTATISPNDTFEYNAKFTDRMKRIKIPLPPVEVDERKKVTEEVNMDRRYAIDAVIVRAMKTRKVMDHQQLVGVCIQHLCHMFTVDIKEIKRRIEDLIVREYLERDTTNPNIYKYLA